LAFSEEDMPGELRVSLGESVAGSSALAASFLCSGVLSLASVFPLPCLAGGGEAADPFTSDSRLGAAWTFPKGRLEPVMCDSRAGASCTEPRGLGSIPLPTRGAKLAFPEVVEVPNGAAAHREWLEGLL
jgi:hypothetical protein